MVRRERQLIQTQLMGAHTGVWSPFPWLRVRHPPKEISSTCALQPLLALLSPRTRSLWPSFFSLPLLYFPLAPGAFGLLSSLETAKLFPNSESLHNAIPCARYVLLHCAGYIFIASQLQICPFCLFCEKIYEPFK